MALVLLPALFLTSFDARVFAAATTPAPATPPAKALSANETLFQSKLAERAARAAKVPKSNPGEFLKSDDPRVNPQGGRITLRNLDLTKPPTEAALRQAGQLGSALTPSGPADPARIVDPVQRKRQEDDNLLFGQAMQKWNEHAYTEAVKIFRQHRNQFPTSPWAGEAELHRGCQAQFSGNWQQAKFSFEWIINNHQKGQDIYQKAKLRRAVLHMAQGELAAASTAFQEMMMTETDWGRRTYAQHWLHQLSLYKAHEVALRDCGIESVAAILRSRGDAAKAAAIKSESAPDARGFSLGELTDFASKSGLDSAIAVRLNFQDLDTIPYPFIAHYSDRHFVTVLRQDDQNRLWIYDPRLKRENALTRQQFSEQWSGLGIIFAALPEGAQLASAEEMIENYGGCCGQPQSESCIGCEQNDRGGKSGGNSAGVGSGSSGCAACEAAAGIISGAADAIGSFISGQGMPVWRVNPVNLNLYIFDIPMWFHEPVGPDVSVGICYNSQDSLNQLRPFGNKWSSFYSTYAMESPAQGGPGTVLIVMPDGRRDNYQPTGAGGYNSPAGVPNILTKTAPYTFQLQLPDGTVYAYGVPANVPGTSSQLLSITDRHGYSLTFTYDGNGNLQAITDFAGRAWTFSYNTQGFVNQITDPFDRSCTFTYDPSGNGNLIGQTDMGGLSYGYSYDDSVYLTSIIKPTGTTTFYVEPADGIPNQGFGYPMYWYPPPGGVMWDNYRITATDPLGISEEFYYSGKGYYGWHRDKVQYQSADPSMPMTRYDYALVAGNEGVVSKVTYADGTFHQYSNYDQLYQNQLPWTYQDERGKIQQFTYNAHGMLTSHTDARGNKTTYNYGNGNDFDLTSVVDGLDKTVLQVGYQGRDVISIKDAIGRETDIAYDPVTHQPVTITDPTPTVWTLQYFPDTSHLLQCVKQGATAFRTFGYDSTDRPNSVTNVDGHTLTYSYDNLNRLLNVAYPDGSYTHNDWGCCTLDDTVNRAGLTTSYIYNAVNQLEVVRDPLGRFTFFQHDAADHLIALIDGTGNRTEWHYDARYRLSKKLYADGKGPSYSYDVPNNIISVTDALNVTTQYTYDDANNLTQISAPSLATVSITNYDADNRPGTMTDGIGTSTLTYFDDGRLQTVTGPWATITLGYDPLGRLTSRNIDGTTATDVIDAYGRLTSSSNPLGTFGYGYATATSPLLTSISYPNNSESTTLQYYGNTGDQRLQEIWHKDPAGNTLSKFDYQYDTQGLGQITQWTQQIGPDPTTAVAYNFTYDLAGQLTGGVASQGNTVQASYGYSYDAVGNRIDDAVGTAVSQYSINNLNQATGSQGGTGVLPIRGTVDKAVQGVTINGNAASVSGLNFAGSASVTSGTNNVTVVATGVDNSVATKQYQITVEGSGSETFQYDNNGNLTNDGAKTYEWDPLNRLTAINYTGTNPMQRTEFTYDGFGQRAKIVERSGGAVTSEKHFIWLPAVAQPAEERDASNNVTKRFYAQGEQISGVNYYFTRDHLGSIHEMTDSTGAIRARYEYDPYGSYCNTTGQPVVLSNKNLVTDNPIDADFGFTGDYCHGPSGLNATLYRFYDSGWGRWLSRDPIAERGGLNLYGYVLNTPLNARDRDGTNPLLLAAAANAAVGAAEGAPAGAISGGIAAAMTSGSQGWGYLGDIGAGALSGGVGGAVGGAIAGVAPIPGLSTLGGAVGAMVTATVNDALHGHLPCKRELGISALVGAGAGFIGEFLPGFRPIAVGVGAGGVEAVLQNINSASDGQNIRQKQIQDLGLDQ